MSISYRVKIVAAVASTTLLLACESREAEERRRGFVTAFVQSVYDGTDFYREHLDANGKSYTQEARALMSKEFRIIGADTSLFTSYEYYLKFSNGADGVVYVRENRGKFLAALSVTPGQKHE